MNWYNIQCSNSVLGEVYSIQHYVIKFVSDLKYSITKIHCRTVMLRNTKYLNKYKMWLFRSPFENYPSGHIITGDLNLINHNHIRKIVSHAPKFRQPQHNNGNHNCKIMMDSVEEYARTWIWENGFDKLDPYYSVEFTNSHYVGMFLLNQYLSITRRDVHNATLCDKFCQWLATRSVVSSGYSCFLCQ